MGTSTVGALPYPPATGVTPRVHLDIQDLTTALDPQIVPKFADTTARDAAYAGMGATPKEGARCWIRNRDGYTFFDGTVWRWEPQYNVLAQGTRDLGPAVTGNGTPAQIILTSTVTLAPGNRRIRIIATTLAGNANAFGGAIVQPRAYISGTGMAGLADPQTWLQAPPLGGGYSSTVSNMWEFTASGTCKWDLYGVGIGASDNVIFNASRIVIVDLGPTDS